MERLARVMEPSYIAVWLRKPVPALDEEKPIDLIARGEYKRVAELVSALEDELLAAKRLPCLSTDPIK